MTHKKQKSIKENVWVTWGGEQFHKHNSKAQAVKHTIDVHNYIKVEDFYSVEDTREKSIDKGEYVNIFGMSKERKELSTKSLVSSLLWLEEKRVGQK